MINNSFYDLLLRVWVRNWGYCRVEIRFSTGFLEYLSSNSPIGLVDRPKSTAEAASERDETAEGVQLLRGLSVVGETCNARDLVDESRVESFVVEE